MFYQIYEKQKNQFHAGSKAREDVRYFLEKRGFRTVDINVTEIRSKSFPNRVRRFIVPSFSWLKALFRIRKNSVVILQNPFYSKQLLRKTVLRLLRSIKGVSIISVIHDVEVLRDGDKVSRYMSEEFRFMKDNSDLYIVHNSSMAREFIRLGFPEDSLVELGLFDYHGERLHKIDNVPGYDVVIAGNLSPEKSAYVYRLGELTGNIRIGLYGPNYVLKDSRDNIVYEGVFAPEDVPGKLNGRFGLVWDGGDIHSCNGGTGEYMRYNDPHKVSLYLFSGIPVIVWKEAAVAQYVLDRKVGFTVGSLDEIYERIESISEEEYDAMKRNARAVSEELLSGKNLNDAVDECLRQIEKMRNGK